MSNLPFFINTRNNSDPRYSDPSYTNNKIWNLQELNILCQYQNVYIEEMKRDLEKYQQQQMKITKEFVPTPIIESN